MTYHSFEKFIARLLEAMGQAREGVAKVAKLAAAEVRMGYELLEPCGVIPIGVLPTDVTYERKCS